LLLLWLLPLLHGQAPMAPSDQLGLGSYRYFISIDFGTHGSGFAYCAASDGYVVKTFQYWPGEISQLHLGCSSLLLLLNIHACSCTSTALALPLLCTVLGMDGAVVSSAAGLILQSSQRLRHRCPQVWLG
jgi:hypothetical protein